MKRPFHRTLACLFAVTAYLCALEISPALAEVECTPLVLAKQWPEIDPKHRKGLLWKVSRSGSRSSYLLGTMHVGDEKIVELSPEVETAFDKSGRLVIEAQMDGAAILSFSQLMFYQDGTDLSGKVGSDLFGMIAELLARYGIPRALAQMMKPWAAYLTLSVPPDNGRMPLDMVLATRAAQQDIPVHGLETIQEQAASISQLPFSDQVELLKDTVCHFETLQRDIGEMKKLYIARELGRLMAMAEKYDIHSEQRYDRLMKSLLWERNRRMVKRMKQYLQEGNSFIAVGALHLPGKDGILSSLESQGYTVTPIY